MADKDKISELANLAKSSVTATDFFPIVSGGDNYHVYNEDLFGGMPKSLATKVVAASDTPNATSRADYECDGIADNVEIQAAIDALPALGGVVQLLEGTFNISDTIIVLQGIIIEGMGEQATSIELPADPDFDAMSLTGGARWTVIRDLELLGNAPITPTYSTDGIAISGSMVHLENLYIRAFPRHGIYATSFAHLRLVNIYSSFNKTGSGAYLYRAGIVADSANQIYIEGGNYLSNGDCGLLLHHVSGALVQVGNFAGNVKGIGITGGTHITLQSDWIEANDTGLYIRTGTIGVGRTVDANEIAVKNSTFNTSAVLDIDADGTVGIRIEDCRGSAIRLGAGVSEIMYEHSSFTAETLLGTYVENGGTSAAIATGETIAHGLASTPTIVHVNAAEAGPTDITISVGAANITVNFGGGGNRTFFWYARVSP